MELKTSFINENELESEITDLGFARVNYDGLKDNRDKGNGIEVDSKNRVAHFNRGKDHSTAADKLFLKHLIERLRFEGAINCDVDFQQSVLIPLNPIKDSYGGNVFGDDYKDLDWVVRRPDIAILKYGMVIEIDGSVHDRSDAKISRDNSREYEYAQLGLDVLRIDREQVFNARARKLVLDEVVGRIAALEGKPELLEKSRQNRRQKMCRVLKEYCLGGARKRSAKFYRGNTLNKKIVLPHVPSEVGYGRKDGLTFKIRGKRSPSSKQL